MKHIKILIWNVLSRLYEKRSTELQVYACIAIFFVRPKLLLFPAIAVQETNNCPVHISSSGRRMPAQWTDCQFTDKAAGIVPCSHGHSEIQTFSSICHFSTCDSLSLSPAPLGCSLAILALTSTTVTQPQDSQSKRHTCTKPASAWSIFQPCQFFLGSRDKGNVLG